MSTVPPARPELPQGTRQLLEELDALMQRMLAVPVNDPSDVPESQGNTIQPAQTTTAALPVKAEQHVPASATTAKVLAATHQAGPALPTPHRKPEPEQATVHLPPTPPMPGPGEVPLGGFWPHPALQSPHALSATRQPPTAPPHWSPPSGQRSAQSAARPNPAPHRPADNWWLNSLIWSNRTFDRCTASLGCPGRWLQGRGGRTLLGWLGIGLLLGSVAWGAGSWLDWTW
jgi:hypothetical protein